jgi:hypothetical protein
MNLHHDAEPTAYANGLELPTWMWSDVLDELYAHASWLWEHGSEELADVIAQVADELARCTMIGRDAYEVTFDEGPDR